MTARRRRTTAPDRAVLDGDSPSRRNDDMLLPHDLRPHFRQSCEAPLRQSSEKDAVFCFDSHRCSLRPPRQAKDFEPGRCRIRFPSEHIRHTMPASSTPAGIVRRHRRTGRSPTPPRRKEQKTQPEKQGAGNGIRPPAYRIAGPLGHEIVFRSQKHFADRRIGNPKRNPPPKPLTNQAGKGNRRQQPQGIISPVSFRLRQP